MDSASTLALGGKRLVAVLAMVTALFTYACQSPLDLDVDRSKLYTDGALHPMRLSLFYYFGDSAYEAIVTDTAFLNTIWIERSSTPLRITIPRLQFSLPDTIRSTTSISPFVRTFSMSSDNKPCDGVFTMCSSFNSWVSGEYYSNAGIWVPFQWMADDKGRQIRLAFYEVTGERLIKASIQILVTDPTATRYESYRALMTMEY